MNCSTDAPLIPSPSSLASYPSGADWPLQSHLSTPALPAAVTLARYHARMQLDDWGLVAEAVELVVSEIVTNAVQASRRAMIGGSSVRLWLLSDHHRVLVQVWDPSWAVPLVQNPGPGALGGRGLLLVSALSAAWGTFKPAACCGKVVWALVGEVKRREPPQDPPVARPGPGRTRGDRPGAGPSRQPGRRGYRGLGP